MCIALELTVPMEENAPARHADKMAKYRELDASVSPGWQLHRYAVEVVCRGVVAPSFGQCLRELGLFRWRGA